MLRILLLSAISATLALGTTVETLREQDETARETEIRVGYEEKLTVLQIKYQLAIEKRYQQALKAEAKAAISELKREQMSFAYDGNAIVEPQTSILKTLRKTYQESVTRLDTERLAQLQEHYLNALAAAEELQKKEPENESAAAYVRELELEVDAIKNVSIDSTEFISWLIRQWIPSQIDHLRFSKNAVWLGDREGRETSLGKWKLAPTKNTIFWRHKGVLQTLAISQGSDFATYTEAEEQYRLRVEALPINAESSSKAIVGDWARLFGRGTVWVPSRYQLTFGADSTALFGSYDPKLKGTWKITEDRLVVDYADGSKDIVHLPQDDPWALSLQGTHHDSGSEWTFNLVRLLN